jgi:hypothetical protein|tara:strand:+ start:924 stop:1097 length:174 start_codon:yes stop_codon:yes gene_type:complete
LKIFNYIKDGICEPITAETRKEANELFIATFDVKIDEVKTDNDKDQYKFEFYETASE